MPSPPSSNGRSRLSAGSGGASRAGGAGSAKAEACPSCKAYTKLLYVEEDPRLEPFADDVATLSLDLLMAEEGWVRHGVNLFLLTGGDLASAP